VTIVGRAKVPVPDLAEDGGPSLKVLFDDMIQSLSDDMNSRYEEYTSIADSATVELDHNFGSNLAEIMVLIYTGTGVTKTIIADIAAAGFVVGEKSGSEKTIIEITAPGSAGPHDFTVVAVDGVGTLITAPFWVVTSGEAKATTQAYSALNTLSDGANIAVNCADGNVHKVILGGNRTLDNPTNLKAGAVYTFLIVQDVTGNRTLAYGNKYRFSNGNVPILTIDGDEADVLSCVSDGTDLFCSFSGGY